MLARVLEPGTFLVAVSQHVTRSRREYRESADENANWIDQARADDIRVRRPDRDLECSPCGCDTAEYECFGEGVFQHYAVEIKSDRPVCVTGYSSRPQTSDGYLALPVNSWSVLVT